MARLTIKELQENYEAKIKHNYVAKYIYDDDIAALKKEIAVRKEKAIMNEQYRWEARALSVVCERLMFSMENPEVIRAYENNDRIRKAHFEWCEKDPIFGGRTKY